MIGVSKDSVKSHQKFKDKHNLPFTLLSDPDGAVCKLFGVLKKKNMYGKTYMGIERSTFIIDEKGEVATVWRGVKVEGHIREVLDSLKA